MNREPAQFEIKTRATREEIQYVDETYKTLFRVTVISAGVIIFLARRLAKESHRIIIKNQR